MRRNTLLAAFFVATCLASSTQAETITFAGTAPGTLGADFELAHTGQGSPGKWAVVRDEGAEGGHALEQSSADKTSYRFPLAIYKPYVGRNVEVRIRFKAITGSVDRAAGIAVRLTTPGDYYVVRANALEDNVRFYRVVKGAREQLQSASLKVTPNQWHTLAIKAKDDSFTISYNGKELYTATDKTFSGPGKVALWTKADSITRFDHVIINPLD